MGAPLTGTSQHSLPPSPHHHPANDDEDHENQPLPLVASLEETYTSLIQEYIRVMCFDNAIFLAERFVASHRSNTSALYLLALCHFRKGAPRRALMVLDAVVDQSPSTDYLIAQCCFELEAYGRAEEALLRQARIDYAAQAQNINNSKNWTMEEWILETTPCPVPNGAAGLYLLGNVCRRSHRKQRAMKYYRMSLQLDPLMWTSYEALCELGATDIDPTSIFGVRPLQIDRLQEQLMKPSKNKAMPLQEKSVLSPSLQFKQPPMESSYMKPLQPMDLGTPTMSSSVPKTTLFQTNQKQKVTPNHLHFDTPNLTPISHAHDASFLAPGVPNNSFLDSRNPNTVRRAKHVAARMYYAPSPETPEWNTYRPSFSNEHSTMNNSANYLRGRSALFLDPGVSETPLRRGGRPSEVSTARRPRALFHSENKTNNQLEEDDDDEDEIVLNRSSTNESTHPEDCSKSSQGSSHSHMEKGELKPATVSLPNKEEGALDRHASIQEILELLCLVGAGYWKLCQFKCREALQLFQSLPQVQHNTGWVLHHEGKAHFEIADYQNAQRCLELMQRVEPHRMKGLELLSTVLWQLKKEVELAHLAQKAVDFDRMSPEAWCVVGNCFSLQKEHETALIFFSRSLQLDPSFTYVHTLSGYEYMANEDFEKAVSCFRNAIRVDERHYNAWYGIGAIYHRQEKYDLAEYHFQRAVSINPQSSVLRCNLGMSQYSNGKAMHALETLAEAFRLDPHNPQARFQRATIYVSLNRPEEALAELEKVRDAAPREATVHFAMGKVLKRLGRPEQAMRCFLTALDLDPKDNQLIKAAMDKLDEPDVEEEVATF